MSPQAFFIVLCAIQLTQDKSLPKPSDTTEEVFMAHEDEPTTASQADALYDDNSYVDVRLCIYRPQITRLEEAQRPAPHDDNGAIA